jgi:hypothetical protein
MSTPTSIPRDVVRDLLPLYAAGEASDATRLLVEEAVQHDAGLASELEELREPGLAAAPRPALSPEHERVTLARAKRLMKRRTLFLVFAWVFSTLPFSVGISLGTGGVDFFFLRKLPGPSAISLVLGACAWTGFFLTKRQLRVEGM